MAEHTVTFHATVYTGRRGDGQIMAARVHDPKLIDLWCWVNRETDTLEEIALHRVGSQWARDGHGN